MTVVDKVAAACKEMNYLQRDAGFPHCENLCLSKFLREINSGAIDVTISIGASVPINGDNQNFSNSFSSMTSPGGMGTIGYPSSFPMNKNGVNVNLSLKVSIPLGPSDTIECINPLFSPIVKSFSDRVLNSVWVNEKFAIICGEMSN